MSDLCECKRNALGDLVKRNHDKGCPDAGKKRGNGGKRGPIAEEARKARQVNITLDGGSERLRAAAKRAGHASGSELVASVVARIEAGDKLFAGPSK